MLGVVWMGCNQSVNKAMAGRQGEGVGESRGFGDWEWS